MVFYELATGKKPAVAPTPNALIYKHCYEEPELPKKIKADLPDEVGNDHALFAEKSLKTRYPNADELVRDLELWRTGAMVKSAIANYKLGTGANEAKREQMSWLQRNMLPVAAVSLLVIGGLGGGAFLKMQADSEQQKLESKLSAPATVDCRGT